MKNSWIISINCTLFIQFLHCCVTTLLVFHELNHEMFLLLDLASFTL